MLDIRKPEVSARGCVSKYFMARCQKSPMQVKVRSQLVPILALMSTCTREARGATDWWIKVTESREYCGYLIGIKVPMLDLSLEKISDIYKFVLCYSAKLYLLSLSIITTTTSISNSSHHKSSPNILLPFQKQIAQTNYQHAILSRPPYRLRSNCHCAVRDI
jgi:hypothetical protein